MPAALIFDVDGTLADTEEAHRLAFNAAFRELGLPWHWDRLLYTRLLAVAGGKERLRHFARSADPALPIEPCIERLHACKTRHYERLAGAGHLPLRPGVLRLLKQARAARLPLAIATTTTPANLDALLRAPLGDGWRDWFAAVGDGATPGPKKPAPGVYVAVLKMLGVDGAACLAFEDSHTGLRAARAAGIPTVVTPTAYTAGHDFSGALMVLDDLDRFDLAAHL
jgi:beta-phosphoglucomutase-like phosphatase (HAD superfamily)